MHTWSSPHITLLVSASPTRDAIFVFVVAVTGTAQMSRATAARDTVFADNTERIFYTRFARAGETTACARALGVPLTLPMPRALMS